MQPTIRQGYDAQDAAIVRLGRSQHEFHWQSHHSEPVVYWIRVEPHRDSACSYRNAGIPRRLSTRRRPSTGHSDDGSGWGPNPRHTASHHRLGSTRAPVGHGGERHRCRTIRDAAQADAPLSSLAPPSQARGSPRRPTRGSFGARHAATAAYAGGNGGGGGSCRMWLLEPLGLAPRRRTEEVTRGVEGEKMGLN